jgi:hypothetical protein
MRRCRMQRQLEGRKCLAHAQGQEGGMMQGKGFMKDMGVGGCEKGGEGED